MSSVQKEDREGGRELLVAEILIVKTGMFNKSDPLENYPSEAFR